jgi:threonine synthase
MLFSSTNQKVAPVSFRHAVLSGLAEDGGLYVPVSLSPLPSAVLDQIHSLTFQEISHLVAMRFLGDDIPERHVRRMVEATLTFNVPLVRLDDDIYSLELFHGPTYSFKDFGARFMARVLSYFNRSDGDELTILTATSGDTGSAVAHGFFGVEGVSVVLLYPRGKVSELQEMQMTTLGGNITALEIEGTFDDCQRLAKMAFQDPELNLKLRLTSANSINISRLIAQMFYYFYAVSQFDSTPIPLVFAVPSGNFGNLTAGIYARHMGLPVSQFVAATNANEVIPEYLETGRFQPRPSISTISNAMDVGNPSNFARMLAIYESMGNMRKEVWGASFTDEETMQAMKSVFEEFGYVMDPHGAVAYLGLRSHLSQTTEKATGIFLETAHPAKFHETVRQAIGHEISIPLDLAECLRKRKHTTVLHPDFGEFKSFLLS